MRVLILLLVSMWATGAFAQSLGDVARREAERRKTVKAPGKVYTNDVLKEEPLPTASPAAPRTPAGAGAPAAPTAPPAAGSGTKPGAGPPPAGAPPAGSAPQVANDEQGWRARVQASREALSRAQLFAEALQSRINGLSADFTARDDPAQRSAVAADRQKSLDELERVRKEIQAHTKALADIQEEGRRAGVPAGWLR
jgi:hypothetical protein